MQIAATRGCLRLWPVILSGRCRERLAKLPTMKLLLAIVSFVVGALCLGFCAFVGYMLFEMVEWDDITGYSAEIVVGGGMLVVSFLVGLAFAVVGVLMLSNKPRRAQ